VKGTAVADNSYFDSLSHLWWSENSYFSLLRSMVNPWRVEYFKRVIEDNALRPPGMSLLEVGCGGGLLSEELAALGFAVTGVDSSRESIAAAHEHARRAARKIDYRVASAESLPFKESAFDAVACCDVLEHIPHWEAVLADVSRVLKPGGLLLFDTINRTAASRLIYVQITQNWPLTRIAPKDLHVWRMFITPQELEASLERSNLHLMHLQGARVGTGYIRALRLIRRYRRGLITGDQLGGQLALVPHDSLALSYAGYAVRDAGR
jgi:2-polyprenyl-6-hydroxyphenyl methylase/3-demethylubiquinone-9 3-methyltransferase